MDISVNNTTARRVIRSVAAAVFLAVAWSGQFSAYAQKPKITNTAAKCSGAWTGSITYQRRQSSSSEKTVERVSARGYDHTQFEMNYNYTAKVVVAESPAKDGTSVGRASVSHEMSSTEAVDAVEKNSCDRGKSWRDMRGSSTSRSQTTGSQGGLEANINVGMNDDGTYAVSVGIPNIRGKVSGSTNSTFSGQCTAKEGKTLTMPSTEIGLDGHSLTSDGTTRVDPSHADHISGSYTLLSPGDVAETITWNLRRCGGPLRITDLKFADMKFPNWDDWRELSEQTGTIDGNWVKVTATVINFSGESKEAVVSFKETYKGDKWDAAKPDMPIKDEPLYVRLDPGEEREVEVLWDTSGYAWFDDGRPRMVQRIKGEIWEKNKLADDVTANLKVAPKPLMLVHGPWSHWKTFETWQNILTTTHSYDWKAYPVGEVTNVGIMNTGRDITSSEQTNSMAQNASVLNAYIKYAQEKSNAWHVDVVAHSIGGLIARQYISQMMPANYADGRPQIDHLVMLGTPNTGTPCADLMDIAFRLTGDTPRVVKEMRQDSVAEFNLQNSNRKGVKFSALAGEPLPALCYSLKPNDGFVPVDSAIAGIADNARTRSIHPDLTSTENFSSFIRPHLAIGPHGDHSPAAPQQISGGLAKFDAKDIRRRVYGSSIANGVGELISSAYDMPPFARSLSVASKQKAEVEIPVSDAGNFGITFMADASVTATLIDSNGMIVGKNLAGSSEARAWFRSIYFDKPLNAGTWKLRLENTGDIEHKVLLTAWSNAR